MKSAFECKKITASDQSVLIIFEFETEKRVISLTYTYMESMERCF